MIPFHLWLAFERTINLSLIFFFFTILIFVFSFQFSISSMFYSLAWNYYFHGNFRFCLLRNQTLHDFTSISLWYHSFSFPHVFTCIFLFFKFLLFFFLLSPPPPFRFAKPHPFNRINHNDWTDMYGVTYHLPQCTVIQ